MKSCRKSLICISSSTIILGMGSIGGCIGQILSKEFPEFNLLIGIMLGVGLALIFISLFILILLKYLLEYNLNNIDENVQNSNS